MSSLMLVFNYPCPLTQKAKDEISKLVSIVADYEGVQKRYFEYNGFKLEKSEEEVRVSFFINYLYRNSDDINQIFNGVKLSDSKEVITFKLLDEHFKSIVISTTGPGRYSLTDPEDETAKMSLVYTFDDDEILPYVGRCSPHPWQTWSEYIELLCTPTTKQNIFANIISDLAAYDCLEITNQVDLKSIDKLTDYIQEDFKEWFASYLKTQTEKQKRNVLKYITSRATSISELNILAKSKNNV